MQIYARRLKLRVRSVLGRGFLTISVVANFYLAWQPLLLREVGSRTLLFGSSLFMQGFLHGVLNEGQRMAYL